MGNIQDQVQMFRDLLKTSGWVLDPAGKWMRRWDMLTTVALLIVAVITPVEVALFNTDMEALKTLLDAQAMFVLNRIIDLIFIADMGAQGMLFFEKMDVIAKIWVREQPQIIKHYLKSWFCVDLISVIPFDLIALFDEAPVAVAGVAPAKSQVGKLKMMRTIRLLRLLKLARILRASRILTRWRNKIGVSFAIRGTGKLCVLLLILVHWIACVWLIVHDMECDAACMADPDGDKTWFTAYAVAQGIERSEVGRQERAFKYSASVYWTAMSLTSIGYGDVTAQNELERWLATLMMLVMGMAWAYIIGNFSSIITSGHPLQTHFKQNMDQARRPHSAARPKPPA
jgi:hypothetical protein